MPACESIEYVLRIWKGYENNGRKAKYNRKKDIYIKNNLFYNEKYKNRRIGCSSLLKKTYSIIKNG